VPAAGQVRILVEASGVHLVDTVLRSGAYSGGPTLENRGTTGKAVLIP
jgi:NADPH:quinone reductase-like Zn-dependent oxidoreductase